MLFSRPWIMSAAALGIGLMIGWSSAHLHAQAEKPAPMVYELRTYITENGRLPALNARFQNHTMKLFEKHGMKNVIYMTEIDKESKQIDNQLVYLLAHKSREAAAASFSSFVKDPEWIAARDASEKDGKIVSKIESRFFTPTEYSPIK